MEISENAFKAEIAMCQKLFKKQKGCAWGKCAECGVIPMLYKLHKNQVVDDKEELRKLKEKIFNGA